MVRGNNEDESALIYGLESQARALTPGPSGSSDSLIRFIVATQSLKSDNYVHLLEYVEENHSLSKSIVKHPAGEVWALCSSNKNCQLLATLWPTSVITAWHGKSLRAHFAVLEAWI